MKGSARGRAAFAAGAAAAAGLVWFWLANRDADVARGRTLYANYCAACHGANLEGQPDWRQSLPNGRMPAPPHDASGHTWHHSDEELVLIVKGGLGAVAPGYESDMPAFGPVLSDDDIVAILGFLKSTWPKRERDYQTARSGRQ